MLEHPGELPRLFARWPPPSLRPNPTTTVAHKVFLQSICVFGLDGSQSFAFSCIDSQTWALLSLQTSAAAEGSPNLKTCHPGPPDTPVAIDPGNLAIVDVHERPSQGPATTSVAKKASRAPTPQDGAMPHSVMQLSDGFTRSSIRNYRFVLLRSRSVGHLQHQSFRAVSRAESLFATHCRACEYPLHHHCKQASLTTTGHRPSSQDYRISTKNAHRISFGQHLA